MPEVITSRGNPQIKLLSALLRLKKAREEHGLFVLEGARLCLDALDAGIRPLTLFITPQVLSRSKELAQLMDAAADVVCIDEVLAGRIADTDSTQGVFAVCSIPPPETFVPRSDGKYLLLHEVRDPGNVGSILRTAAALGADGALLCGCAELWSPKVLRASMGGIWRVPVYQADAAWTVSTIREAGLSVFAAALRDGAKPPGCLAGSGGCAVLIGNEGTGLPDELINACDGTVMIPMHGKTQSLGAAMAAGILLWEMLGHRE